MNRFTQEKEVLSEHLDEFNHVNNIRYLEWVQEISKKHWNRLTRNKKYEFQIWIVRNHSIVYKKQAKLGNYWLNKE